MAEGRRVTQWRRQSRPTSPEREGLKKDEPPAAWNQGPQVPATRGGGRLGADSAHGLMGDDSAWAAAGGRSSTGHGHRLAGGAGPFLARQRRH